MYAHQRLWTHGNISCSSLDQKVKSHTPHVLSLQSDALGTLPCPGDEQAPLCELPLMWGEYLTGICAFLLARALRVRLEALPAVRVILRVLGDRAGIWTLCNCLWSAWLLGLDSCSRIRCPADVRRDKEKNILVKSHLFGTLSRKLGNSTGILLLLSCSANRTGKV